MKAKILFVCIENSCRSQMAEGFARKWGRGVWEVWSGGSEPSGKVNERAVQFMRERDVDIRSQHSKGLPDLPLVHWDVIATMGCGDACPNLPAKKRVDWDLRDPKTLPEDEFRKIRDEIEHRVKLLLDEFGGPLEEG